MARSRDFERDRNPLTLSSQHSESPTQQILTIDQLDSDVVKLKYVPVAASQTCQGQKLIRPIVDAVPYSAACKRLSPHTIEQFNLTKKEQILSSGITLHQFDHIS